MNCVKIVGIRQDGSEIWSSEFYPSKGWCYASATKIAIDIKADGNPDNLDHLEVQNTDGRNIYPADKRLMVLPKS